MKLKKIFSFENLKSNLKNIWNRFPVSVVIIFVVATIFFILLNFENNFSLWKKNLQLIVFFIINYY